MPLGRSRTDGEEKSFDHFAQAAPRQLFPAGSATESDNVDGSLASSGGQVGMDASFQQ